MKVPLLDLQAQYASIRADVDAAVARVVKSQRFILGPEVEVTPMGLTYLFGDWIDEIVEGQRRGLIFAVLATALMMLVCLRSLGPGLLSMIPNLLPIVSLGGYVGLAWDTVDSDTVMIDDRDRNRRGRHHPLPDPPAPGVGPRSRRRRCTRPAPSAAG